MRSTVVAATRQKTHREQNREIRKIVKKMIFSSIFFQFQYLRYTHTEQRSTHSHSSCSAVVSWYIVYFISFQIRFFVHSKSHSIFIYFSSRHRTIPALHLFCSTTQKAIQTHRQSQDSMYHTNSLFVRSISSLSFCFFSNGSCNFCRHICSWATDTRIPLAIFFSLLVFAAHISQLSLSIIVCRFTREYVFTFILMLCVFQTSKCDETNMKEHNGKFRTNISMDLTISVYFSLAYYYDSLWIWQKRKEKRRKIERHKKGMSDAFRDAQWWTMGAQR